MIKYTTLLIVLLAWGNGFAQKIVDRKNKLTGRVQERFQTIIQTDKQVRQGRYKAIYNGNVAVATGNFNNDNKTGLWRFFGTDQKLLQVFNYDNNTLVFEEPEGPGSDFSYLVDRDLRDSDKTTKPVRIGGRYYGYLPYLRLFRVPKGLEIVDRDEVNVVLEILVSPYGRLADFKIHMLFDGQETIQNIGTEPFTEEDKKFLPATLNGQPVMCRIMVQCYINDKGEAEYSDLTLPTILKVGGL